MQSLFGTQEYDELLLFKGSTACPETDKDHKWCKSNDGNRELLQGVLVNFDCKISSQNELEQTNSMAVITILPLYVLAKAALSLRRANDNNFHILKLLGNGFKIPEYNGFNTKLTRVAGVGLRPATHVTYIPLINKNLAEPDRMLTTMKL